MSLTLRHQKLARSGSVVERPLVRVQHASLSVGKHFTVRSGTKLSYTTTITYALNNVHDENSDNIDPAANAPLDWSTSSNASTKS